MESLVCMLVLALILPLAILSEAAPPDVPEAEKALLDTVDPWGLAFSDQLARFQGHFAEKPNAPFLLGITHDLVKIWPVKYWFRGETTVAGAERELVARERWAAAGETQGFQVVALPRMGAPRAQYRVQVDAPGARVTVYRQVFVKTSDAAAYPRYSPERWPDPLLEGEDTLPLEGLDCGAFWVDVALPADHPGGRIECRVSLTSGNETARAVVPIQVVPGLSLEPKAYPFVAWFRRGKMTPEQFRQHCGLVLDHHVVPVDALKGAWDPANPSAFDDLRTFLAERGQWMFEVDSPRGDDAKFESLYAHLKEKGWLENTWVYSFDEPDERTWREQNVPFARKMREKFPGIGVYVASDWHENMAEGVDAWMTDISASGYDLKRHASLKQPQLWHYYCHLPVRWQMRAPLVDAPNMQIDNPALEQRLALWISQALGAKAVFLWSGDAYTFGDDFWETLELSDKLSPYPYAGVHNGNGWIVYPGPDGGPTIPSLRLKLVRDGLEDLALMQAAKDAIARGRISGERAEELERLLDPVPGVFVHPQYFDRLPETLLDRREAILKVLAGR